MFDFAKLLSSVLFVVSWLAGIVLANGLGQISIATIFPPYAWYLVVERIMLMAGVS